MFRGMGGENDAGGAGEGLLFRKGQVVRKVREDQIVDALIEEIAEIEKERAALKEARLHIAGGIAADAKTWVERAADHVTFHGQLAPDALRNLYQESDVYVLPSHEEGLARSVLEAMASGLAVIVTRETGTGDIVKPGEDGWIVEAGDERAYRATGHKL